MIYCCCLQINYQYKGKIVKIVYAFQQGVPEEEKEEVRFKLDEIYLKYPEVLLHVLRDQFNKNIHGFDMPSLKFHDAHSFNEHSIFEGSFTASLEDYDGFLDVEKWSFMIMNKEHASIGVDKMKRFIESSIDNYYLRDYIYEKMKKHYGIVTNEEYMMFRQLMGSMHIDIHWEEI